MLNSRIKLALLLHFLLDFFVKNTLLFLIILAFVLYPPQTVVSFSYASVKMANRAEVNSSTLTKRKIAKPPEKKHLNSLFDFKDWKDIAAVAGLLAFFIKIFETVRWKPLLSFRMHGGGYNPTNIAGTDGVNFGGFVKNPSLEPNSITNIYLIIWKNKWRNSAHHFGNVARIVYSHEKLADIPEIEGFLVEDSEINQYKPINLPLFVEPRQAKNISIEDYIPHSRINEVFKLLSSERVKKRDIFELAFEDIMGNLFDMQGRLRNRKEIDLWLKEEETYRTKNFLKILYFWTNIIGTQCSFFLKCFAMRIGIWH